MTEAESENFSETMFKRLWWQGYKGRFAALRWPTGYGFSGIISAIIMTDAGPTASKEEGHTTQSDSAGLFQFTGLHGASLGVAVSKLGYEWGARGEGYQAPVGGKSSPDNRAILTMWKLHGPEPLNHSAIEVKIPHDGTIVAFDIASGKQSPNGNLRVAFP
jgi:hypothetical protein